MACDTCEHPTSKKVPLKMMRPVLLLRRADTPDEEFKAANELFNVAFHRTEISPHSLVVVRNPEAFGDYHDLCVDVRNLRGRMLNNSVMKDWLESDAWRYLGLNERICHDMPTEGLTTATVFCAYGKPVAATFDNQVLLDQAKQTAKVIAEYANYAALEYVCEAPGLNLWTLTNVVDGQTCKTDGAHGLYNKLLVAILEQDRVCSVPVQIGIST